MKYLSVVLMSVVMSGCTMSPEQCSPTGDPGMLDKLGCVVSGSYQKRVDDKAQEIHALSEKTHEASLIVQELESKRSLLVNSREERLKELDKVQSNIDEMRSSLKAKGQLTKSLEEKLKKLEDAKNRAADVDEDASVLEKKQTLKDLENYYRELLATASD